MLTAGAPAHIDPCLLYLASHSQAPSCTPAEVQQVAVGTVNQLHFTAGDIFSTYSCLTRHHTVAHRWYHLTLNLLADASMGRDDDQDELADAGSPGSNVSDRETYATDFMEAAPGSPGTPYPNQVLHHPEPFHAQPMPHTHTVFQQAMHPQQGPHRAPHPHPLKPGHAIKFVSAPAVDCRPPQMLPAASNAAAVHQHLPAIVPDAAPALAAHRGMGYHRLQPVGSDGSAHTQHTRDAFSGGDSPLSRIPGLVNADQKDFQAFLQAAFTPLNSGVNRREDRPAAVEKVPEAVDTTGYHSRHAVPTPTPGSAAAAFSDHAAIAANRIASGLKSRKRPHIEAEQEPEAVSNSRDAKRKTLPTLPTAVDRFHAVRFCPVELRHSSGAAHITATRQYHEDQRVQQCQATHLTVDRVANPDRKRRKQRHTASPAADSVPSTPAATAAATIDIRTPTVPIPAGAVASSQAAAPTMGPPAAQAGCREGDVVWAKLGGDPWWPATVSNCLLLMHSQLLCFVSTACALQDWYKVCTLGLYDTWQAVSCCCLMLVCLTGLSSCQCAVTCDQGSLCCMQMLQSNLMYTQLHTHLRT